MMNQLGAKTEPPAWPMVFLRKIGSASVIAGMLLIPAKQALASQDWSQGTYVWDSRSLLSSQQRQRELNQLQNLGIQEILIGLTGEQVKNGEQTQKDLLQLLQSAHARGLRVSLLLGDPSWIQPEGRPELINLIKLYQSLPFSGLHLDLEVEQLGWPVPTDRLRQWIITLKQVEKVSPWPVSISSHPRWFESNNKEPAAQQICVPCQLNSLHSVSLMIYQRNPERVAQRSLAIARRWPQLRFRIAQSVEAQIPADESWHGTPIRTLQKQVDQWRYALSPAGIKGVDWQDWSQYPKEN